MSQQINLLNPALLTVKEWVDARVMAVFSGILVLLLLLMYVWSNHRVNQLKIEQQALSSQLTSLKQEVDISVLQHKPRQPSEALLAEIKSAEVSLEDKRRILDFLRGGGFGRTEGFSSYMEAFARQTVKGVWLTGFAIDDAANQIKLSGRAIKAELVPQYIAGLAREAALKGREFAALKMVTFTPPANTNAPSDNLATNASRLPSATQPIALVEFDLQSKQSSAVFGATPSVAVGVSQ